jgi:D-isomer specific 2-hydroxyacid dehydrogenase, NAD binding domain
LSRPSCRHEPTTLRPRRARAPQRRDEPLCEPRRRQPEEACVDIAVDADAIHVQIDRLPQGGAIVVNAARGTLVDDEALIAALGTRRVAAAGLDVFENEPKLHPG